MAWGLEQGQAVRDVEWQSYTNMQILSGKTLLKLYFIRDGNVVQLVHHFGPTKIFQKLWIVMHFLFHGPH